MPANANYFVIFVPGGMGSKLKLGNQWVWTDHGLAEALSAKMIVDPALLLPWLPLHAPEPLDFYDDFLSFLGSIGYSVGANNLVNYPYDWRLGMEQSAAGLCKLANQVLADNPGKQLVFITHSLGCLVVRWALLQGAPTVPMIPPSSVNRVIAAAPPSLGIPCVFRGMLEMPSLTELFDIAFAIAQNLPLFSGLTNLIEKSVVNVSKAITSLLELLPPNMLTILRNQSSAMSYGAFSWAYWPTELSGLLQQVQQTQMTMLQTPWTSGARTLIACNSLATEAAYLMDPTGRTRESTYWSNQGDGSVLFTSAQAFMEPIISPPDTQQLVSSGHEDLLNDPAARAHIAARIT